MDIDQLGRVGFGWFNVCPQVWRFENEDRVRCAECDWMIQLGEFDGAGGLCDWIDQGVVDSLVWSDLEFELNDLACACWCMRAEGIS